jgi:large subunit ribosomal protein L29
LVSDGRAHGKAAVETEAIEMKVQNYREMSLEELGSRLEELQRHLFDLRAQAVTEKLENSRAVTNVRRDIARIKTVMREIK